jgi:uncharacterized protein (TIGR02145 family)
MNKIRFTSLTASLVLATTLTLSCEDKEKDKPATVAETASTAETATPATPNTPPTFTDSRDGKTYKKVTIGSQTWMAENLNFAAKGSKCYGEGGEVVVGVSDIKRKLSDAEIQANCTKYGRLYDWKTALKACPSGWHLPSNAEWSKLYCFVDGDKCSEPYEGYEASKYLKAANGWNENDNGTDTLGFSALPGGFGWADGSFGYVGMDGNWWSASEVEGDSKKAYGRDMDYNSDVDDIYREEYSKSSLHSVRCIKD